MPGDEAERTSASVSIAAPPDVVLDVIADLETYPEWVEGVREVVVLSRDAQDWPTRVRFRLETSVIKDTYVLAYTWLADDAGGFEVHWALVESSVLTALDGSYLLRPVPGDASATDVTYTLGVGLRLPMPRMLRHRAERTIIDTALVGLKRRAQG